MIYSTKIISGYIHTYIQSINQSINHPEQYLVLHYTMCSLLRSPSPPNLLSHPRSGPSRPYSTLSRHSQGVKAYVDCNGLNHTGS